MNRHFKRISLIIIAITLVVLSMFSAFADTVYEYFGFKYTLINNFSVSIYGKSAELNNLVIPNNIEDREVTEIRNRAFKSDENITSVSFSKAKKLNYIGMYAFADCTNLSGKVILPENITFIGTSAFENCGQIENVDFRAKCNVPSQCFSNCANLNSVTLNGNIEKIESYAFENCTNLKYIDIPKSVTSIADSAFNGIEDITLVCRNSTTFNYAESHGLKYEIKDLLYGDANSDGFLNILDVTAIQKYKIGDFDLSDYGMTCADVNHDGSVTIRDATLIQMKLAKYDVDF